MGVVLSVTSRPTRRATPLVRALAFLYTAQATPFGFATEYLPVVLGERGSSYA